ncbi:MAG: AAA family ATPase, partial [Halanaerobiales bacterium]|nr:AAA family ATPase [Halanaerobiales bacterium]
SDTLSREFEFTPEELENDLNSLLQYDRVKVLDNKIYLAEHYKYEYILADKINRRLSFKEEKIDKLQEMITAQEENLGPFNSEQKKAIKNSLQNKLSVINGREGTGKAEVVKAAANIYKEVNPDENVIITSPEGKDAERLGKESGLDYQPLSSLLSYEDGEFQQDELHPIKGEGLIIVTEFHKCGLEMTKQLFVAAHSNFKIALLGDSNKISGYGSGNVFLELLLSSKIDHILLEEIHNNKIREEFADITESIIQDELSDIEETANLYFIKRDENVEIFESLQQVVSISSIDTSPFDYQIIVPEVENLDLNKFNLKMRELLNPESSKEFCGFKKDDKIIINQDNNRKNIYKGNIGFVTEVAEDHLHIQLKDRQKMKFREEDLKTVSLGYVTTVKNNQGNNFPNVVAVFPTGDTEKFDKQLLYTAVAPVTDTLFLIGNEDDIEEATNRVRSFNNSLAEKIEEERKAVALCDEFTVKNLETDEELVYQLVPEDEEDFEKNKISTDSPLGDLVYQKLEGSTVTLNNDIDYEIIDIKPIYGSSEELMTKYRKLILQEVA